MAFIFVQISFRQYSCEIQNLILIGNEMALLYMWFFSKKTYWYIGWIFFESSITAKFLEFHDYLNEKPLGGCLHKIKIMFNTCLYQTFHS